MAALKAAEDWAQSKSWCPLAVPSKFAERLGARRPCSAFALDCVRRASIVASL